MIYLLVQARRNHRYGVQNEKHNFQFKIEPCDAQHCHTVHSKTAHLYLELVMCLLLILLVSTAAAATGLVVLGDDGCTNALHFLLLLLDLLGVSFRVRVPM